MSAKNCFREVLAEESDFPLTDSVYDLIVDAADEVSYGKREAIIVTGVVDPDVYIIKDGIVRGYILSQGDENNIYFGLEGTLLAPMQSFSQGAPSIICVEACCQTTVLRLRKADVERLMDESSEFCRWIAGVFTRRSCYDELKAKVMNGDARWRYEWLERCRPELFEHVPLKAIASYLKMTEVHVSRIRKQILSKK